MERRDNSPTARWEFEKSCGTTIEREEMTQLLIKIAYAITPPMLAVRTTGKAPTFLSAIKGIASNTIAVGAVDQTVEPFCAKIPLTVPAISIDNDNYGALEDRFKSNLSLG